MPNKQTSKVYIVTMLLGNLQTAIMGVADLEVVWLEMEQIPYCGGKLGGNFGFVHDQAIFICL